MTSNYKSNTKTNTNHEVLRLPKADSAGQSNGQYVFYCTVAVNTSSILGALQPVTGF